jgi:hypothetical protein
VERCLLQKAVSPRPEARHPPEEERPSPAWEEARPLRLPAAVGSRKDLRLAGRLSTAAGGMGNESPHLPRLPPADLLPHPPEGYFGMTSTQTKTRKNASSHHFRFRLSSTLTRRSPISSGTVAFSKNLTMSHTILTINCRRLSKQHRPQRSWSHRASLLSCKTATVQFVP